MNNTTHKPMVITLVFLFALSAFAAPAVSPAQQRTMLEQHMRRLAKTGSALPGNHELSMRYKALVSECLEWDQQLRSVADNPEAAEDTAALLWRIKEAVHRLGMLELRTRIVKAALAAGEPEPRYGLLAASGLERIVDDQVPDVPVARTIALDAAPGETVTARMVLVAFDRGLSKPCYPSTLEFVKLEPLAATNGSAIPVGAFAAFFEDAVPADSQRFMIADADNARGIQRTDYLTGAAQDFISGVGWLNYIFYLHADTAWGMRLRVNVPANQPAGVYHGRVCVWPSTEDYPAYAEVEVRVHAVTLPASAMKLQGGFNTSAFYYYTAVTQKKTVEELDKKAWLDGHLAALAKFGVQAVAEDAPKRQEGWLFVTDEADGPLALTTTPLRARLLAWEAWVKGLKGVQVERVHDWTGTWQVMNIWPGPGNPRGYNNYVKDPRRIGSLYYPQGESLRLLALREGFQDAAWLTALQAALAKATDDAWVRNAKAVLARASALAAVPAEATPEALTATRANTIALLERTGTQGEPVPLPPRGGI